MSNKPNQVTKVKEPLVRVTKRDIIPTWQKWAVRLMAILLSLVVVTIFVFSLTGIGPGETFGLMWEGVFSNMYYRKGTIFFTAKLLCIAVALAPAFKMKFWNIGAEGQVLMGALSTAIVMVNFSTLSTPLLFTIMIVSSVVMGAIWGLIPAIFKAKWNVNETLFTLMMNYVAMQLVDYYYNIWKGSKASLGMLNPGTKAGYLPEYNGSSNNIIVTVVLIITVLMYIYLKKTKHGYEIAVVGESENTARYFSSFFTDSRNSSAIQNNRTLILSVIFFCFSVSVTYLPITFNICTSSSMTAILFFSVFLINLSVAF